MYIKFNSFKFITEIPNIISCIVHITNNSLSPDTVHSSKFNSASVG